MNFNEPLKHRPKSRVELHVHLDGAIRHETIWEVMRQKGLSLPGNGSLTDLKEALQVHEPKDLAHFLHAFSIFMPAMIGDLEVLERISYEFVEDQARESVAYCEARFSPHLLLPSHQPAASHPNSSINGQKDVQLEDILEAVLRGLTRGEQQFGTKVRVILCCIRGHTDWSWEVLRLCEEYRDRGVVGIDMAGDEGSNNEEKVLEKDSEDVAVFEAAKEKGIHRTIHSGEAGPAKCVKMAVELFGAERVGHGYHVLEDEEVYKMCLQENIHFEVCPHSSYLTGAIQSLSCSSKRHPVLRFAEDEASFSISSDDPTVTGTRLSDEYKLLVSWGLTEAHLTRANFQAALHSFLPPAEKKQLIDQLQEAYGFIHYSPPATSSSSTSPSGTRTSTPPPKPSVTFGTWAERS
ncbi:adenosine deaminase-like isoform X1 [Eriocheir sinensis]|uniref:adenosine deaminase-like isoform X1 n=1 Tax=Eriocheir sinensis TaxID=95602 RepID=UPI0021CA1D6A|nr:adenosine deaminase-like isoform X1 [Eriocheir sinensis]